MSNEHKPPTDDELVAIEAAAREGCADASHTLRLVEEIKQLRRLVGTYDTPLGVVTRGELHAVGVLGQVEAERDKLLVLLRRWRPFVAVSLNHAEAQVAVRLISELDAALGDRVNEAEVQAILDAEHRRG